MKYLVLYKGEEFVAGSNFKYRDRSGELRSASGYTYIEVSTWKEFASKKDAIEFARQNKGVIVEAFEWDIKKEAKV